ncbi:MAG: aminotransferase class I/II-fold pyridoxal phosphate-dependent enzyme [Anaerolineae bacterium]|nr:aminotransferase class I/II-fold pyridoxal phosphate-dependent enzyme [Anaerolineae bacterium]
MNPEALAFNELKKNEPELKKRYQTFQSQNLAIDMTRGKPCPEQLDLSLGLLTCVNDQHFHTAGGADCRNYGGLDGIPEAKALFAQYLEVEPGEIIVGGNASLKMMYDTIIRAMVKGVVDSDIPWGKLPVVKFLCPCPGYDRHFAICQHLGIQMIPIAMQADGPDMDAVEEIAAADETVKCIWCVPKYSNPTGVTFSNSVVERLAGMQTAAKDFRIFWDNAYTAHHLTDTPDRLRNILTACRQAKNPERVFIFGSTSKVSFAGAGLALMAGSRKNIEAVKQELFFQTIGPDKLNQLRHVLFFKDMAGIEAHMQKNAAILKPKFDAVQTTLVQELDGKNVAEWSQPRGGYFVSFNTPDGCAQTVVNMAAGAGVKFTPAGATFPYKKDPRDRNIRIAPSFPSIEDIRTAMEVLAVCTQLASIDQGEENK